MHKFCSESSIQCALQIQQKKKSKLQEKNEKLMSRIERILHDSWHKNSTSHSFLKELHLLIESGKLSEFDLSFLCNWTSKKMHGRHCKADEQARAMDVLYSNKLGQKT